MRKSLALALIIVLSCVVSGCKDRQPAAGPLVCHVGGTMRPVMLELVRLYESETGQAVEINSSGSGELLAHIELQKSGDLYVCHDPFLDTLMTKFKMGVDAWTIAEVTPVIIVPKGNPQGIRGLSDLTRQDVKLALTDYRYSTLGRMLETIFGKVDIDFQQVNQDKRIISNKSGGYVANLVATGNADAGVVWNAVAWLRRDVLDIVAIPANHLPEPAVDAVTSATGRTFILTPVRVTIATLTCSRQPEAARRFAEFVASPRAAKVFEDFGFTLHPAIQEYENGKLRAGRKAGVDYAAQSDVTLRAYIGAGLRPALDELIPAFTAASGIKVEPDYGGSGIIISRARQDPKADIFMPGDVWYVDRLQELSSLIESKTAISWFVPVIIVRKGNPKNIKGLDDFFRPDVSVALGRAEANQIGRVSDDILKLNGLDRRNLQCKESLTVNELGVWVQMGNADAAIVWDALAANMADTVDVVPIPTDRNIISQVVVGLMTTSAHKSEARQFVDFLLSDTGRDILRSKGYRTEAP